MFNIGHMTWFIFNAHITKIALVQYINSVKYYKYSGSVLHIYYTYHNISEKDSYYINEINAV